jgi:hypothetical protein
MMLTKGPTVEEAEYYRRCKLAERRIREVGEAMFGRLCWLDCLTKALGLRSTRVLGSWLSPWSRLPNDYQQRLADAVRRTRDAELAEAMKRHEALTLLLGEIEADPLPVPVLPGSADVPAGAEVAAA